MLTIDLLRHGALEGGVKYRGSMEEALTAQGRASMDSVWAKLQPKVTRIICSPLSRCAEPAQDWAAQAQIPCLIEPQIQELYYGDWEGLTAAEIEDLTPGLLAQWRADPTHMTPPHGEAMLDFSCRVNRFWQQLCQEHGPQHILLVGHSGSIRLLLAAALQAPIISTRHLHMPYACWSRMHVTPQHSSLCFHAKKC